jgi:hypothetical protein
MLKFDEIIKLFKSNANINKNYGLLDLRFIASEGGAGREDRGAQFRCDLVSKIEIRRKTGQIYFPETRQSLLCIML